MFLEKSTPLLEEFLDCIGEKVQLEGWTKFRGGLDVKSNEKNLPF